MINTIDEWFSLFWREELKTAPPVLTTEWLKDEITVVARLFFRFAGRAPTMTERLLCLNLLADLRPDARAILSAKPPGPRRAATEPPHKSS
jgi:hypothetical protein